ncbi:MAG: CopD family protein [Henriciella sp.]
MLYLLVKSLHIIFVIAWMAGLLILPRYKLHQMNSQPGEVLFETMMAASSKLRRIILTPAMILSWVFGLSMIAMNQSLLSFGWLYAKLFLVLGLTGFHGYIVAMGRKIDLGETPISLNRLKLLNELPFLIMIGVVFLVTLKPA